MSCLFGLAIFALALLYYAGVLHAQDLPPFVQCPPRMTKQPLEAQYYLWSGGDETFPCEAQANPAVNESGRYFWKKDGNVLVTPGETVDIGSHYLTMTGPHGSLTVRNLQNSSTLNRIPYQGKYQCFAANSLGTALSRTIVVKTVNSAIDFFPSVEDENINVQEGESLTKPCVDLKFTPSDQKESKWIFSPAATFEKSSRISETPNRSIIFSNVAATDDGLKFYCSSKDLLTRITIESAHYTLNVRNATAEAPVTYHSPEIVFPTAEQKIVALKGEELTLPCIATGNPTPTTSWYSPNRFELHDFNRTLRIAAVKFSNTGIYTCIADSKVGSMRRDVKVVVESTPYFANISKEPTDIVAQPDENVKMKCGIVGQPTPKISWMKNGKVLPGRHGVSLHLRNLTEDDTAVYQCIGENRHGSIMGQGFVNVLAIPPKPWPDFERTYRKLERTMLNLPCVMFSVTQNYNVLWTRDNQPQTHLLRDTRINEGKDHRLVIKNVNVDDSDIYRCNASNKYGSTTISMQVTVLYETALTAPKSHYIVKAGDDVTMAVKLDHDPLMKNIRTTWRTTEAVAKGFGTTLAITDAKTSDAGRYIVEVETELDKNVTSIYLTVQDRPEFPRNVTVVWDSIDKYTGMLSWSPPININFSPIEAYHIDVLESTDSFTGKWRRLGNTTDMMRRFSIVALQPFVKYNFRVWAENGVGLSLQPSEPTATYLTPPKAPGVNPIGVTAEGTSPDTIIVRWNSVESFKHAGLGFVYEVSWRPASGGNWLAELVEPDQSPSFTIPDTETFTEYEIKVQSSNNEGPGPEPELITALSGQDVPLVSPTIIPPREDDKGTVFIEWQPVPTKSIRGIPIRYVIRCKDVVANKVKKRYVSPDTNNASVKLEPYTEYKISVTLENGAGESKNKTSISFSTKEKIPEAPERFEVVKEMLNEIRLAWNEPTKRNGKIIGYELTYEWEENGKIMSTKLKNPNERIVDLSPNTSFALTLCAKTSAGVGTNCSTTRARTIAPREPAMPEISVATNHKSFDVTWADSSEDHEDGIPVRGYVVQHRRKEKVAGNWTSSKFIPASSVGNYVHTLTEVTPNSLYELRVLAENQYGNTYSATTFAKTSKKNSLASGGVGAQLWFIIVLCVAALVVLVIVLACFIRRRRGGKYPVLEKEEQLVKQNEGQTPSNRECGRYSASAAHGVDNRTAEVDEDSRKAERHRLRGDSVSGNSIEAFGNGTTHDYDEDGSFIDQYGLDQHSESKLSSPGSAETNSLAGAHQSHSMADFKEEAV